MARSRSLKQQEFRFRTWGGKRKGAGRPRGPRKLVPHLRRASFGRRMPAHVTVRMQPRVYNLRSRRGMTALGRAFFGARDRFGLRLVHFAVQGNHIHFIVEAQGRASLSRGMQGLNIRIARALNRMMESRGGVFDDRYHAHILKTPAETKAALSYLRKNHETHTKETGPDRFCSLSD